MLKLKTQNRFVKNRCQKGTRSDKVASLLRVVFVGYLVFAGMTGLPVVSGDQVGDRQIGSDTLNRVNGTHIRLISDLEDVAKLQRWVDTFDAAVPLWSKFWDLPTGTLDDWSIEAFVMRDVPTFARLDLIDPRVPDFPFAYALDDQVWVREQPSDYYTMHLILHEGIHSLAFDQFGDTGPTWFREGVAELLATHRGSVGEVQINQVPTSRSEVPHWGRFKRMNQLRSAGRVPSIETVMKYEPNLRGDVAAYGWSWAAASLFAAHPEYRETLLQAASHGRDTDRQFNRWFFSRLSADWPIVQARWRILSQDFDYGYDFERERVALSKLDPVWDGKPIQLEIAADKGWQSIGVRLLPRMVLDFSASGEVVIDDEPRPWNSTPDGVTIEYHQGLPLGQLIGRIVPLVPQKDEKGFVLPLSTISIGTSKRLTINQPCWFLMRTNDQVGRLADNLSSYQVTIGRGDDAGSITGNPANGP